MDVIQGLAQGFATALTPINILYVLLGCIAGTLIGALPGIGPPAGVAILIPLSFGMDPTTAMILMAGLYYGAMYGGTITSVLVNVPGESSSVMTTLDGYQMALKGRAGPALGMAAIASFIAGTFSVAMLMLLAPPIANAALAFGPPEYVGLLVLGLMMLTTLVGRSQLRGLLSALFGLMLAVVGLDAISGGARYTYGTLELLDGIDFLPVAVGLFGVAEVLVSIERTIVLKPMAAPLRSLIPTGDDWRFSLPPIARGSVIGFLIGVLPGAGATVATFIAYGVEKRFARRRAQLGTGVIEGVASPEAANNASTGGALIPLLTLGLPGSGTTAVMLGALIMLGVTPGPLLFQQRPDFVWSVIASMYIGNVALLILNIAFVPAFVWALRMPYSILGPVILVLCIVGVYSINYSTFDIWIMFAMGLIGYGMRKLDFPAAPAVLALVLGQQLETSLRQSLLISRGSLEVFFTRPIALTLLVIALAVLVVPPILRRIRPDIQRELIVGEEV
ncbi:MAG: tripartite tricarboxylate transporter permease [Chloroflexota bacterium]|nr:tripartite tricarboxylate transporter permease [Chloroflexota bacterium]